MILGLFFIVWFTYFITQGLHNEDFFGTYDQLLIDNDARVRVYMRVRACVRVRIYG